MKSAAQEVIDILAAALKRRQAKNGSYSLRAFARDVQVSPSFMSLVLKGKRPLSLERARAVASALKLTGPQTHRLLKAVALSLVASEPSAKELIGILTQQPDLTEFTDLDIDRFQFFNHWYHVAILDLSTCADFDPAPVRIAKRLGVTPDIAATAVDRLLRLGLLTKVDGILTKTDANINIPAHAPSTVIRNFHGQMIEKAKQALSQSSAADYDRRAITGITFSVAPENIAKAKTRIAEFKREMHELVENGRCTQVYQMNIQFFPLTKGEE